MATWGELQPDGSVNVISNDSGTPTVLRNESWAVNQGLTGGGGGYQSQPALAQPVPSMTLAGGLAQVGPAVDAAQSAAQQQYLRDRMNLLEIPMSQAEREQALAKLALDYAAMTGYYAPGAAASGAGMSQDQALDYIWQHWSGLPDLARSNGWDVSTPEKYRSFLLDNWLPNNAPGKSVLEVARGLGAQVGNGAGGLGGVAAGATGALPTFAREQFNARNWQNVADLLASKSGPRDYALYNQLQPKAAFGAMTGSPSWEQAFAQWFNAGQPAAAVAFPQPNTMRPQDWLRMSPSQQQMALGSAAYNGINAEDWFKNMQAGWPTGQAAPTTNWR